MMQRREVSPKFKRSRHSHMSDSRVIPLWKFACILPANFCTARIAVTTALLFLKSTRRPLIRSLLYVTPENRHISIQYKDLNPSFFTRDCQDRTKIAHERSRRPNSQTVASANFVQLVFSFAHPKATSVSGWLCAPQAVILKN